MKAKTQKRAKIRQKVGHSPRLKAFFAEKPPKYEAKMEAKTRVRITECPLGY